MNTTNPIRIRQASRQKGVSLFVTLVSLVVITLAAVALIRTVDTATLISGNLAFRQAATSSGDTGVESAINWLALAATNTLENGDQGAGYYATIPQTAATEKQFFQAAPWANGLSADLGTDRSGNTIRYVIERMCTNIGTPDAPNQCMKCASENLCSQDGNKPCPKQLSSTNLPLYRITVRITGPRNTVSYVQAFSC